MNALWSSNHLRLLPRYHPAVTTQAGLAANWARETPYQIPLIPIEFLSHCRYPNPYALRVRILIQHPFSFKMIKKCL